MTQLSKLERMKLCLSGEEVDRPPFSLWYHFGLQHAAGDINADAHLRFYEAYNLDWLKMMCDCPYPLPDGLMEIKNSEDLARLEVFNIEASPYMEQLKAIDIISKKIKGETLCIDTVFNAWGIARRNLLRDDIVRYMRYYPDVLHSALKVINQNMIAYCRKSIEHGSDGLFIAVTASKEFISYDDYIEFMKPYDIELFSAVRNFTPNIFVHIHGDDLYFDDVIKYPIDGVNWADKSTGFSLDDALKVFDGILMGGIDHNHFSHTRVSVLQQQIKEVLDKGWRKKFMLSPGCSIESYAFPDIIHGVCKAAGIS
jgi:uroporphyrinogen decarboxylase